MQSFLTANLGKWRVQRSSFYLELGQDQAGRLDLTIDWIPAQADSLGGLKTTWQGNLGLESRSYLGHSTILFIPDGSDQGRLIVQQTQSYGGTYVFADEALTLRTHPDNHTVEERIWFGGTNLRIRTVTVKRGGGFSMMSFFSEVRSVPPTETS